MNIDKKAALAEIEQIEKRAEELRKLINAPDEPTYEYVVDHIKPGYWFDIFGNLCEGGVKPYVYPSAKVSIQERLRAKWLNIAAFVNDTYNSDGKKWLIRISQHAFGYVWDNSAIYVGAVCFNSKAAACEAVRIMGEADLKKMAGIE